MPRSKKTPGKRGPAASKQPKVSIATVREPRTRKRKPSSDATKGAPARKQQRIDAYTTASAATSSSDEGSPLRASKETKRASKGSSRASHTSASSLSVGSAASAASSLNTIKLSTPMKYYHLSYSPGKSPAKSRAKRANKSPHKTTPSKKVSKITRMKNPSAAESGSEGERANSKAGVREVTVPGRLVAKWTPISKAAQTLLRDAFLAANEKCLSELSGSIRRQADRELQKLTKRVEEVLKSAVGPKRDRRKSYSSLNRDVLRLKDSCLSIIERNTELEEKLQDMQKLAADRQEKSEQLAATVVDTPPTIPLTRYSQHKLPEPPQEGEGEGSGDEQFLEYVAELASISRLAGRSVPS